MLLPKPIDFIKLSSSALKKGLPTVPFNLGVEKKINPFLRADDDNFIKSVGLNSKNASESFREIRLKKDSF